MATLEKIKRSDFAHFLNITPSAATAKYARVGKTTSGTYTLNPQSTTEQYIENDTATTTIESYQPSIDNPMVAHKGDEVFEYIFNLANTRAVGSACETQVLFVYKWEPVSGKTNQFKAQLNDCSIAVNSFGGDAGSTNSLDFDINISGDPVIGTATIGTDGTVLKRKISHKGTS